jgi:alpha-L-fucosidase 2
MAWKINWWARLEEGDHAYSILKAGLTYIGPKNKAYKGGGTYPNLFDGHPPFQIDGNFGGTAGITEMLLQSYDGNISLLPALPTQWSEGAIRGIRAKGGFILDLQWRENTLRRAIVYSELGGNCRLRTKIPVRVVEVNSVLAEGTNSNPFYKLNSAPAFSQHNLVPLQLISAVDGYMIDFQTEKGKYYTVVPVKI